MFNSITSSFKSVLSDMEKDYNAIHNPKNKKNLFSYFLSHFNMFSNSNSTKNSTVNKSGSANGTTSPSEVKLLMKHYNTEVEKLKIHMELKSTQRQLIELQKKYDEAVVNNKKLKEVNEYQHSQLEILTKKFAKSFGSNTPSKKPQPKENATPKKFESGKFIFDMKFFSKN